jgi:type II secretory pathway pseudopilin PulG
MSPHGVHSRRGLTLVELLVTVSIMMLLVVVALPSMTPSSESRRVREAARQLNVFFGAARAQAMLTGRPVGVMLARNTGLGLASGTLFQVEVPPAYSGETINSTARMSYVRTSGIYAYFNMSVIGTLDTSKIAAGDQVQLNNQGPLYTVAAEPSRTGANAISLTLDIRDRRTYPWPSSGTSPAVPYKFYRQPVTSSATPLELPSVVSLDLQSSGTDSDPSLFTPITSDVNSTSPSPIIIMFSPSGAMDRVYFNNSPRMIREPLYLLIGRRDRVQVAQDVTAATLENQQPNWFSPTSIWMTVSPLTGIVSAKENFRVPVNYGTRNKSNLSLARTFARQAQTMGGR